MAYNPFNIFRRNQKTIFAVITVFIMFTFVLSSGLGGGADFFDWLPRMLGSSRAKGDALATLDGRGIYEKDLVGTGDRGGLRLQRVMANKFMYRAAAQAVEVLEERAASQRNRMAADAQQLMAEVRRKLDGLRFVAQAMVTNPRQAAELARLLNVDPVTAPREIQRDLENIAKSATLRAEDKEVAQAMLDSIGIQQALGGPDWYFASAPNRGNRDLIEFLLWQKKADQLGIRFTPDDVRGLIQKEFHGALTPQAEVGVVETLKKEMNGFNMEACLKAIGEEFRVRAAQAALLGPGFVRRDRERSLDSLQFPVPYEALEYFREEVSPTTYAVVPIPAANFVDRVADPDEKDPKVADELKRLYDQYAGNEPDPRKETPGFKVPRRVTVGWLAIKGDEPYYQKLAEEALKAGEPAAKVGSLLTVPVFGTSPAELAAAVAPVGSPDAVLDAAYKRVVTDEHARQVADKWSDAGSFRPFEFVLDTSVQRPGVMAAAAAAVAGDLAGFGSPLGAAVTAAAGPVGYEARARMRAGLPVVLGAVPGPGMFNTLMAGEVGSQLLAPPPLPLATHRPSLLKDLVAENARRLAARDAEAFVRETRRWSADGKAKDKWWVRNYVNQFAARRGLTVHTTTEPRGEWTLEEDPALKPLVDAQRESLRTAAGAHGMAGSQAYVPFGDRFFLEPGRRVPATGTFAAFRYPNDQPPSEFDRDKAHYVAWRATEEAARPRAYEAAKADVVAAWKRGKARELARKRAEEFAEAVRKSDATAFDPLVQNLEDAAGKLREEFKGNEKAQARVEPFLVRGVAPLTTVPDPTAPAGQKWSYAATMPTRRGPVQPFHIPASENLRYPAPDLRKTLLDDRTKGPKHVVVTADAPKDVYLVAVLLRREEKNDLDYRFEVAGLTARDYGGSVVQEGFRAKSRENALKSVLGLLKMEFGYAETEEQKKKLDESEKRGGDA